MIIDWSSLEPVLAFAAEPTWLDREKGVFLNDEVEACSATVAAAPEKFLALYTAGAAGGRTRTAPGRPGREGVDREDP